MSKTELKVKQNPGVIIDNFAALEAEIDATLSEYEGAVFTEDSKDIAKKELASLRSRKKELDDNRKDVKRDWMKPYEAFEKRAQALLAKFDKPINLIDGQVKDFDENRKKKKRADIEAIYEEMASTIKDYIPINKIYDSRWENVSYNMKTIREELSKYVEDTTIAVEGIKAMNSEKEEAALDVYRETLSMAKAISVISNYERQKAEILAREEERRKQEEERQRQAEINRAKAAEREAVRNEERIRNETKRAVVSKIKEVDEKESAPLTAKESLRVVYTVVATPDEIKDIEIAFNSLGVYFERKDV